MVMKRENIISLLILFFVVSAGCNKTDRHNQITDEIIQTDLAFSKFSDENGAEAAFLAYADEGSVLLRDGSLPLVGKAALRDHLLSNPAGNISLTWKPLFAEMAKSGDFGYTYGTFVVRSKANPEETVSDGCYVSIWKKQPDGSWKWVLDTGTQGLTE